MGSAASALFGGKPKENEEEHAPEVQPCEKKTTTCTSTLVEENAVEQQQQKQKQTLPFPKNGVKMLHFDKFIDKCGGRSKLEGLTTAEVSTGFMMGECAYMKSSYCDMLEAQGSPDVGRAEVFISHAWKYKFLDVVNALQFYFSDKPDIIVWFDFFSNNQHVACDLDFYWWSTTFRSAIDTFHHTIMVISPWDDPIPYTRAWCIFEAYCTADTNSRFDIAMSSADEDKFLHDVEYDPSHTINRMLETIRSERSDAWQQSDREKIHDVIKRTCGFAKIDGMVFEQMRSWVIGTTVRAVEKENDPERKLRLMSALGNLHQGQSNFDAAEATLKKCLEERKTLLGDNHPDTIKTIGHLMALHMEMGKLDEGEKEAQLLGDDALSLGKNASLWMKQGKFDDAEKAFKKCISYLANCGEDHPDLLTIKNNLATLYDRQKRYDEAIPLYKQCLEKWGTESRDSISVSQNLAVIYSKKNQLEESTAMFQLALERSKTLLGDENKDTIQIQGNLAQVLRMTGKKEEALPLLKACHTACEKKFEATNPLSVSSCNNYAKCEFEMGNEELAVKLSSKCYEACVKGLGGAHQDTICTKGTYIQLLRACERGTEADAIEGSSSEVRNVETTTVAK